MKTISVISVLFLFIFMNSFNNVYSQMEKKSVTNQSVSKEKPNKPFHKNSKLKNSSSKRVVLNDKKTVSSEEKILIEKIKKARKSGNHNEMEILLSELHKMNGIVSIRGDEAGTFVKPDKSISDDPNAINSLVFSGSNIQGFTTVTEQRGANAGRIWAIFAHVISYSFLDTYYSDDDGISWTFYDRGYGTHYTHQRDELDAEIIEGTSGNKYLYVISGQRFANGKRVCVLYTMKITGDIDGTSQVLEWPGFNNNLLSVNYYKPRITSDNAQFMTVPLVYIAACQDSAGYFSEKVAYIINSFNSNPTVLYKPQNFHDAVSLNPGETGNCDIAWFHGSDTSGGKIMLVESAITPLNEISLYETIDFGFLSTPEYKGALNPDDINKSSAYVASNGLFHDLMIVNRNEYSVTDSDIQYFLTTDDGITWSDGFVSYTYDNDYRPDIAGIRNVPGYFNCAYVERAVGMVLFNDVIFSVSRNNVWGTTWGSIIGPMNTVTGSSYAEPRPGIKLNGTDSCLILWSEHNNENVWCASGFTELKLFKVKAFFEGYYDPFTFYMTRPDTITVSMRHSYSPYEIIESHKTEISNIGTAEVSFTIVDTNTYIYLVINSRNTIETWGYSASAIGASDTLNYDFIYDISSVYGENEKLVGTHPIYLEQYAMYSGDVNQDGTVDATDMSMTDNDATNFVTGYISTDLTGDDFVDASDLAIADNNASNFVSVVSP